ncbi:MAG: hypothetical protein ABI451_07765, partial [Dokdonella sp.]
MSVSTLMQRVRTNRIGILSLIALWLAVLLPVGLSLRYIIDYGSHTPFADTWGLMPYVERFYNGQFGLEDLFAQHNEHRIVATKLILLGLGWWTGFDGSPPLLVSWACLVAVCFAIGTVVVHDLASWRHALVLMIPVSWLILSPRQ